jgi:hypothetical protein
VGVGATVVADELVGPDDPVPAVGAVPVAEVVVLAGRGDVGFVDVVVAPGLVALVPAPVVVVEVPGVVVVVVALETLGETVALPRPRMAKR